MNALCYMLTVVLTVAVVVASGTYLIITEHYGWAWVPFLALFGVKVRVPWDQS